MQAVSLFAGCGGADLGILGGFNYLDKYYCKNRIKIIHASDIDVKAINTYNKNFKNAGIVEDISKISLKNEHIDLVVGGFPCQSFSSVNPTKNPNNTRSQLYNEMIRIVKETKPKFVIGENVRGFYTLHDGKYFKDYVEKLTNAGYNVHYQILNSADFGVPQLRKRLIIVGIRKDLKIDFKFPKAMFGPNSESKKSYIPIKKVVKNLSKVDKKYYFSEKAVAGVKKAKPNMKRALAQDLNSPSLTITSHLAKVSLNSRDPVLLVDQQKEIYRRFTPLEAARIQSFPDNFEFEGSEADAYRQIGNAIPPVLMWHVIRQLLKSK